MITKCSLKIRFKYNSMECSLCYIGRIKFPKMNFSWRYKSVSVSSTHRNSFVLVSSTHRNPIGPPVYHFKQQVGAYLLVYSRDRHRGVGGVPPTPLGKVRKITKLVKSRLFLNFFLLIVFRMV